jgi:hypothetical protein
MSDIAWNIVIGIVGLLVNGVGLGFVAVQVTLARHQAAEAQASKERDLMLRRKESTMSHLMSTGDQKVRSLDELPDDFDLSGAAAYVARAINDDPAANQALSGYLSYWEAFALGTSLGVYDLETVVRMSGARISVLIDNYRPYFSHRRAVTGIQTLYEELEWLGAQVEAYRQDLPTQKRQSLRGAVRLREGSGTS